MQLSGSYFPDWGSNPGHGSERLESQPLGHLELSYLPSWPTLFTGFWATHFLEILPLSYPSQTPLLDFLPFPASKCWRTLGLGFLDLFLKNPFWEILNYAFSYLKNHLKLNIFQTEVLSESPPQISSCACFSISVMVPLSTQLFRPKSRICLWFFFPWPLHPPINTSVSQLDLNTTIS